MHHSPQGIGLHYSQPHMLIRIGAYRTNFHFYDTFVFIHDGIGQGEAHRILPVPSLFGERAKSMESRLPVTSCPQEAHQQHIGPARSFLHSLSFLGAL